MNVYKTIRVSRTIFICVGTLRFRVYMQYWLYCVSSLS